MSKSSERTLRDQQLGASGVSGQLEFPRGVVADPDPEALHVTRDVDVAARDELRALQRVRLRAAFSPRNFVIKNTQALCGYPDMCKRKFKVNE